MSAEETRLLIDDYERQLAAIRRKQQEHRMCGRWADANALDPVAGNLEYAITEMRGRGLRF